MTKLKIDTILDWYDEPLTFIARDEQGKAYLCYIIGNGEYLTLPINNERIGLLLRQESDLRDIYLLSNTYNIAKYHSDSDIELGEAKTYSEIEHLLPAKDHYVNDSFDKWIRGDNSDLKTPPPPPEPDPTPKKVFENEVLICDLEDKVKVLSRNQRFHRSLLLAIIAFLFILLSLILWQSSSIRSIERELYFLSSINIWR